MKAFGRAFSSVTSTWQAINPATLSGAIDVVVIEREDGDLACSPFHIRFGKFSLLLPSEKKVDFFVNGQKADFPMKLGEGGEAFFVFQTEGDIPEYMQTSPVVSPAQSPIIPDALTSESAVSLQEPDYLDLNKTNGKLDAKPSSEDDAKSETNVQLHQPINIIRPASTDGFEPRSLPSTLSPHQVHRRPQSGDWTHLPSSMDHLSLESHEGLSSTSPAGGMSSRRHTVSIQREGIEPFVSKVPPRNQAAIEKVAEAITKLGGQIRTHVQDNGDVMLDAYGYKSTDEDTQQFDALARQIFREEIGGQEDGERNLDTLIGRDQDGNLWVYASEEAKQFAESRSQSQSSTPIVPASTPIVPSSPAQKPREQARSPLKGLTHILSEEEGRISRAESEPAIPSSKKSKNDDGYSYAKTLRLTSEQLKSLNLKEGKNSLSFSVTSSFAGKATVTAYMFYWKYDVPVVISDIDGTITKSDVVGHIYTMIGRDWTHQGVAKLFTDITNNGYHLLYLTSRSVGQADTTRGYLKSIVQDKYTIPEGPVIMSPDRTFTALRREVIQRKPEVFKMACLRDLQYLFYPRSAQPSRPFYAGFGNRITDALSYRSVGIPPSRIFTINSNAEVRMELLELAGYKSSYIHMSDLVDHFFPPVRAGLGIDEAYTDLRYWKLPLVDISDESDDEEDEGEEEGEEEGEDDEDEGDEGDEGDEDEDELDRDLDLSKKDVGVPVTKGSV